MEFPEQLKSERKRLGLTRPQAAKLLDVSVSIIEKWETGSRTPAKIAQEGALQRLKNHE
jgi:DNA-binding transcriptional regulator YiaG